MGLVSTSQPRDQQVGRQIPGGIARLIRATISPLSRSVMARKRKIIVSIATSADGFIARPDGSVDWLDTVKGTYGMSAFYRSIDTILWGRKTYDVAIEFQKKGIPGSAFDPKVKNYLFTRTMQQSAVAKGVEIVNEPVKDFASHVRATPGKNIWMMGGGGVIASFLDEGQIDEFIICLVPVMIGEGIPLIAPGHRTLPLKLVACDKFADGVVRLHYSVKR
jgi:dihydrofolate reductase